MWDETVFHESFLRHERVHPSANDARTPIRSRFRWMRGVKSTLQSPRMYGLFWVCGLTLQYFINRTLLARAPRGFSRERMAYW